MAQVSSSYNIEHRTLMTQIGCVERWVFCEARGSSRMEQKNVGMKWYIKELFY
jgi:hypothetical protein